MQKSVQLSPEDACSVRESNTPGFISVNNSRTYSVTSFRTICIDEIEILVALTQFIKTVVENFGRSNIFVRAVKSEINHRAAEQPRRSSYVVDCVSF